MFLILALVGGKWLASRPARFSPRETAMGTHYIEGWVGSRASLDTTENRKVSCPYWDSNFDLLAILHSQLLCQLAFMVKESWNMRQEVVMAYAKASTVKSMKISVRVTGLCWDLTEYLAEIMKWLVTFTPQCLTEKYKSDCYLLRHW
jgi:hypothetical protein